MGGKYAGGKRPSCFSSLHNTNMKEKFIYELSFLFFFPINFRHIISNNSRRWGPDKEFSSTSRFETLNCHCSRFLLEFVQNLEYSGYVVQQGSESLGMGWNPHLYTIISIFYSSLRIVFPTRDKIITVC